MMKSQLRVLRTLQVALLLLAVNAAAQPAPQPAAKITDLKPTVILVSIDGCRWDFPDKYPAPTLRELIRTGIRAEMVPSFPSKTFPNHYTLVTGLYPGNHGIVANNMWDDEMNAAFKMDDRAAVKEPRWWGGEPIWVTLHKQGQKSAAVFWPGSETPIAGIYPDYWHPYEEKMSARERVTGLLKELDRPAAARPTFNTLYFSAVDTAGHDFGPESPEVAAAVQRVDAAIAELIAGLQARGIYDQVNLIVVADHGMGAVARGNIFLEDFVDPATVQVADWSPVLALRAKDGNNEPLYAKLKKGKHWRVYRKADLPQRYHYSDHPRIMPIIAVADPGWNITTRKRLANRKKEERGTHGYDPQWRDMHAIFIAHGPAFKQGVTLPPFENVNVYSAMAKILGVKPAKNDGDAKVIWKAMVTSAHAAR